MFSRFILSYCIPFYSQVTFQYIDICYILFIHSSVVGHLGFFSILAIMNNAAMNICVQVCGHKFSFLLGIYLGMELLGHMILVCLTL